MSFTEDITPYAKIGWEKYGINPTMSMAQAILESGNGTSGLTKNFNNAFGIKAVGGSNPYWDGAKANLGTKEDGANGMYSTKANFRVYPTLENSYMDYLDMIGRRVSVYKGVRNQSDWKVAVNEIHKSPYATDKKYDKKLIAVIEKYDLERIGNDIMQNEGMKTTSIPKAISQTANTTFLSVDPSNISKEKVAGLAVGVLGLMGITAVITNIGE